MNPLVAPAQRPYLRSHPLAASVATGMTLGGLCSVLFPDPSSLPATVFSPAVYYLFSAVWVIGGLMVLAGITRGIREVEAAGSTLLSGGLLVYFAAVVSIRGIIGAGAGSFILFLAFGYALRTRRLVTSGYVEGHG